ncbi:hypothetical protein ACHAXR_010391 [Thalassiosira sp. AJA248-18]
MSATPRRLETVAESEWFHILAQIISSTLLFILIFGMSATVDVRHLRQQVHNKFAILTGVATQFIIMPVLGYVSVILLSKHGLTEPMAISLLIVTASPGGSYSNWWISMFNGDLALSVTMTAISTLISTIMLPANLLLYVNAAFGLRPGEDEGASVLDNIDWPSLFVSLAIVIGAIGMGMFASVKISSHRFNRFANRMGSLSGVLLIVFSAVVSTLSGSNESQIWGQPWSFYVGVTAPCLVGLFIATVLATLAGLRKPEVISVGVECCYQNVGIATSAAVAMFDDPIDRGQALCVPLFYGLMEGIVLGIYCIVGWKMGWTKAPRDEKFCVMVVTTYEVESDDSERSEFIGGQIQMDEERQQGHASADTNNDSVTSPDTWRSEDSIEHESSWSRPWSLFISKRKRKASEEVQPPTELPRRRSLADSLNESLESISQLDAITDLVAFPDQKENIQYSRCRINSEDSVGAATAITSPISETASAGSPSSLANSSSTGSPTAKSLAKKF